MYYLGSRYYDSVVKRFISSDDIGVILASPYGLIDKNLYSYCNNNPVMRVDHGGKFWDFVLDVVSIVLGACDLIEDPSWEKAGLLAVDVVLTVVPFIPSVSGARHLGKVDDVVDVASTINKMDNVADAAGIINKADDMANAISGATNFVNTYSNSIRYTDKVLTQMNNVEDVYHAFPSLIDTFVDINSGRLIKGGDGVVRNLIELPGSINKTPGIFEYIIEPNGMCNHRYFKELR